MIPDGGKKVFKKQCEAIWKPKHPFLVAIWEILKCPLGSSNLHKGASKLMHYNIYKRDFMYTWTRVKSKAIHIYIYIYI